MPKMHFKKKIFEIVLKAIKSMVSTHLILGFFHHKMEQADIFKQEQSEKQSLLFLEMLTLFQLQQHAAQ